MYVMYVAQRIMYTHPSIHLIRVMRTIELIT